MVKTVEGDFTDPGTSNESQSENDDSLTTNANSSEYRSYKDAVMGNSEGKGTKLQYFEPIKEGYTELALLPDNILQ